MAEYTERRYNVRREYDCEFCWMMAYNKAHVLILKDDEDRRKKTKQNIVSEKRKKHNHFPY